MKPIPANRLLPCACCGVPSSPFKITNAVLCDAHFDLWLKNREPKALGAHQAMAEFIEKFMTPEWRKQAE